MIYFQCLSPVVLQIINSIAIQLINMLEKKGILIPSNLELRMDVFVLIRELIKPFGVPK